MCSFHVLTFHSQPLELSTESRRYHSKATSEALPKKCFQPQRQTIDAVIETAGRHADVKYIWTSMVSRLVPRLFYRTRRKVRTRLSEEHVYVIVVTPPRISSCRRDGGENCTVCCIDCVLLALECVHTRLAPLSSEL